MKYTVYIVKTSSIANTFEDLLIVAQCVHLVADSHNIPLNFTDLYASLEVLPDCGCFEIECCRVMRCDLEVPNER